MRPGEVIRQCLGELHTAEEQTHGHGYSSPGPHPMYRIGAQAVLGKDHVLWHIRVALSSSGSQCLPLYSQCPSVPKLLTETAYSSGFPQAMLGGKIKRDMNILFMHCLP